MRSPFVLGLVKRATDKNELKTDRGARTPEGWGALLWKDPDLRDEWQCETVCVLGGRVRADPDKLGDPEQNVGGYWWVKVVFAAIKAAWNLYGEGRRCGTSFKDTEDESFEDETAEADLLEMELRLDLAMLIDGLEDPREREVMRLSEVEGYDYPEIAAKLGISYENVRGAVERAREAFQKRLGVDQAELIDALEDPRQRAVMRMAALKCNHKTIAAELGISPEQVQADAKQARKTLQDRLRWVLLKRLRLVA